MFPFVSQSVGKLSLSSFEPCVDMLVGSGSFDFIQSQGLELRIRQLRQRQDQSMPGSIGRSRCSRSIASGWMRNAL
jgi:hypothetical protein